MDILKKIEYEDKKESLKGKLLFFGAISGVLGTIIAVLSQNWQNFYIGALLAVCCYTPMKVLKALGVSPVVGFILTSLLIGGVTSANHQLVFVFILATILDIGYGIFKLVRAKHKEEDPELQERENVDE